MPSCAIIKFMILLKSQLWISILLSCSIIKAYGSSSQVITNPAISRRCDALLKKRLKTIELKQKTYALIERNRQAFKSAPLNRKTIRKKLDRNHKYLQKRLEMAKFKVTQQEEQIIRKGCPSIPL
jgi:hypothetical protein